MLFLRTWPIIPALALLCHGQDVPVVTLAKDLYRLNRAEILRPTPVKLRGIVTYNRGGVFNDFTMQDETGGLIVDAPGKANAVMIGLVPGQEVEIEGVTMTNPPPTPRVQVGKIIPGPQVGLPEPLPFTPEALLGGAGRLCYIEFTGVIREAHVDHELQPPRLVLTFGPAENRLAVWLARYDDPAIAALKPDTRVRVHGVSMAWTSANLQPYSTFVVAHDPRQIDVLSLPRETSALPVAPIGELLSTTPEGFESRRQRVRGTVTLHWPGEAVVIQDESGGIRTAPAAGDMPRVGQRVDCHGFPSSDQGRVVLDEAAYGDFRPGSAPRPESIDAGALVREVPVTDRDGALVRTTGVFRGAGWRGNHAILQMESAGIRYEALLPPGQAPPQDVPPGSLLALTGVTRFLFSGRAPWSARRAPDRFEIHLPSMADIAVLSKGPWWTKGRLAIAGGVTLVGLLLSLAWAVSLRRQVALRSALLVREIRARHDHQLLGEERSRLAADLHDTLSQSLSGAALQLEIAESLEETPAAGNHRALARRLLDRGREDLRRAVWDLTPSVLLNQDLPAAFRSIVAEQFADSRCEISVEAGKDLPVLPERTRSHLLRVGQEAIHNAIRHGRAGTVRVTLAQSDSGITLAVDDDGCGFDPDRVAGAADGHFGLGSMRNRIRRLGGRFEITTSPRGTRVSALVPTTQVSGTA